MDTSKGQSRQITELFVLSLLSLYVELVVIRWLSSEIRIFAYFKNIPLMACLFGLGLGMALANSRRDLTRWFPFGVMAITAVICLADPLDLVHVSFLNPFEHYLIGEFGGRAVGPDTVMHRLQSFLPGLGVLVGVFYLIVFTFLCLGQRLGQLVLRFQPLVGYGINVAASLVGIGLFTAVSMLSLSPPIWLLIGLTLSAFYFRKPDQLAAIGVSLAIAFLLADPRVLWSPYYRITTRPIVIEEDGDHPEFEYGYNIHVNHDAIEGAYNNDPRVLAQLSAKRLSEPPTTTTRRTSRSATGNDASSCLPRAPATTSRPPCGMERPR